jgi:hypothetical protein
LERYGAGWGYQVMHFEAVGSMRLKYFAYYTMLFSWPKAYRLIFPLRATTFLTIEKSLPHKTQCGVLADGSKRTYLTR